MYIRRYADFPGLYVPDEGEVVLASRSASGPFIRAAVTSVKRRQKDAVRVDFVWLDSVPEGSTVEGKTYIAGTKGHVLLTSDGPSLIRRRPVGEPSDNNTTA